MNTTAITDFSQLQPQRQQAAAGSGELGQQEFLKLMLTQFQHQDPLAPMENGEFLGQIAQFGTVTGIDELKTSFNQVANSIQSDQALNASSLVGRNVLAASPTGLLEPDGTIAGAVDLASSTSSVAVDVVDSAGQVVRSLNLGPQSAGLANFEWDGLTAQGEAAVPGQYTFAARFQAEGRTESAAVLVQARVQSVTLGGASGGLTLNFAGLAPQSLAEVRQIL